ncbi:DMT family transporter [Phycicoccus sp. CSK15P-2]|uniref:DMT family transporter n=1 Tax=Phycicoccus sp. CSK15P-2 TaxID=2807627 RepID=UPI00194E95F2|nr:DMT family transporter [Phycicoccus sp. CSK15P-2]MBM6402697.1 DMT family transporter [Phycicoccus sp. CSK15P-2]
MVRRTLGVGLVAMLLGSFAFGTSGPFAKSLIDSGWSPGAVVLVRMAGATLLLLPVGLWTIRQDLGVLRRELGLLLWYGLLAVGAAQLGYFQAIEHLTVGVALLIEYLGIVVVVLWVWMLTRRRPHVLTAVGVVLAVVGLGLVLDLSGRSTPSLVGVAWAVLAAVGLAGHYVLAGRETHLPPLTFAGAGLLVGSLVLLALGTLGIIDLRVGASVVDLSGSAVPAWVSLAELVLVAAAAAYVLGVLGTRHLGSTLASFVGLTEVIFAVLVAWVVLGELPGPWQLAGGVVILGGVLAVRLGEARHERRRTGGAVDFEVPAPVA